MRVWPGRDSTLGSYQRSAQDAVAGNHPLPTSPTPWWRSKFPLLRSGVFGAEWEGLGVGGAHQQQECRQPAPPRIVAPRRPCTGRCSTTNCWSGARPSGSCFNPRVSPTLHPGCRCWEGPPPNLPHSVVEGQMRSGVFAAQWPNLLPWGRWRRRSRRRKGERSSPTSHPLFALASFGRSSPRRT